MFLLWRGSHLLLLLNQIKLLIKKKHQFNEWDLRPVVVLPPPPPIYSLIDGSGLDCRLTTHCGRLSTPCSGLLMLFYGWSAEFSCQDMSGDESWATALHLWSWFLCYLDFYKLTFSSFLTWLLLQMFFGKPEVGNIVLENLGFGDRPRKMLAQTRVRGPWW